MGAFNSFAGFPLIIMGLLYGFFIILAGFLIMYGSYVWIVIREIAFNTRKTEGGDQYPQIDKYCSLTRVMGVIFIVLGIIIAIALIVLGVMSLRNY